MASCWMTIFLDIREFRKLLKVNPVFFPLLMYFIVIISPREKFTTCFSLGKKLQWGPKETYLEAVKQSFPNLNLSRKWAWPTSQGDVFMLNEQLRKLKALEETTLSLNAPGANPLNRDVYVVSLLQHHIPLIMCKLRDWILSSAGS